MKKKTPTYLLTPRRGTKRNSWGETIKGFFAVIFGGSAVIGIVLFWLICALAPVAACIAIIYYVITNS